jgi:predicted dehydrogenase
MPKGDLRFGLIGAGEIGQVRAAALTSTPGCRLVAVADLEEERARRVADRAGATLFADYRRIVEEPGVDAVVVSTPPDRHEEVAAAALAAGKHVLCEKPLAPTVEACRRMLEAARRSGRCLATGFNHRYFPAFQFVKNSVENGMIGELSHVRAYAGHAGLPEFRQPWEHSRQGIGGGALMDNGSHLIDLARHLLGEVSEVQGIAQNTVWKLDGAEDNGFALLRGSGGPTASLHASWTEWRGYRFWIEAYGDRGMARAAYGPMFAMAVSRQPGGGAARARHNYYPWIALREKFFGWKTTAKLAFQEELRDFLAMIDGKPSRIADGFAGFRAVEIAHAVYKSSESKTAITLSAPF